MKSPQASGFTLVELLISISIFTVITAVSVFSYSGFNSSVLVTNLAYDIALSVRQAQFYGITVKQSGTNGFDSGYGVHFTRNSSSYVLFEDVNANHLFDPSGDISLETYAIQKGNKVDRLCVVGTAIGCNFDSVDVSFVRPNPDTFVARFQSGVQNGSVTDGYPVVICVSSPSGVDRKVTIEATGQISVSTSAPECAS